MSTLQEYNVFTLLSSKWFFRNTYFNPFQPLSTLKNQSLYFTLQVCLHKIGARLLGKLTIYQYVKFIYSEKATKFCEISTRDSSYVVPVKTKVEISHNFLAFSEYMNFTYVYTYIKIYLQKKDCQCLRKCIPSFINEIFVLQSFTRYQCELTMFFGFSVIGILARK